MKLPWGKKDKPGLLSTEFQLPMAILASAYKTMPDGAWWTWAAWASVHVALSVVAVFYAKYRTDVKLESD